MKKLRTTADLAQNFDPCSQLRGRALQRYHRVGQALQALAVAPHGQKCKTARALARQLGIKAHTLWGLRSRLRLIGPIALVDRRQAGAFHIPRSNILPSAFSDYVRALSTEAAMTRPAATRFVHKQLARWRDGDALAAIPGYSAPPQGNPPPGWSPRNLARHLAARPMAVVVIKLREDGSTRIAVGKLATISGHPLFQAVSDSVRRTKEGTQ